MPTFVENIFDDEILQIKLWVLVLNSGAYLEFRIVLW